MKSPKSALIIAVPLALLLAAGWFFFIRQSATDRIKQQAEKCAHAILAKDFGTVVDLTQKRMVDLMRGKDAIVATMTHELTQMHDEGVGFDTITIGDPQAPLKSGAWSLSLVPEQIVLKAPGGRLKDDSYLLALSDDNGKNWSFVSLTMTAPQFFQVYPELNGAFAFPEHQQPVYEKDK